jgi:hypothetical protein
MAVVCVDSGDTKRCLKLLAEHRTKKLDKPLGLISLQKGVKNSEMVADRCGGGGRHRSPIRQGALRASRPYLVLILLPSLQMLPMVQ